MNVIFAPHPDDEIIGCYRVIRFGDPVLVIFTKEMTKERKMESEKLSEYFDNVTVRYEKEFSNSLVNTLQNDRFYEFYFPDPFTETHPEHKILGFHGYKLWKEFYLNIIFYSTNMNTNYLYELNDDEKNLKEAALNTIYPSQSDLWKFEKKYIFYESKCIWMK